MEPTLIIAGVSTTHAALDRRILLICAIATVVGLAAGLLAQVLIRTIWLITNLSFHGAWSFARATPPRSMAENTLGIWLVAIPVIGAAIIGLIARFGSRQVAGHGIPEAMEQVLRNQSRIPPRLTFLKPLSAAISIGTGGPFGAEGPIIATGGALGSLIGQSLLITAAERKTLLAAGAGAGIAAAFGSPVAAVLLAIELLLFEFRPRSIIPVAFACAAAASIHYAFEGSDPFFAISGPPLLQPNIRVLVASTLLGALMGAGAIGLTRAVAFVEHAAEKLPVHWMWRPALGAIVVGVIGYFAPYTLGSGYFNIHHLLAGQLTLRLALTLFVLKFLSWTISLGSGTAGGTLAPVFTIGGSAGAAVAIAAAHAGDGLVHRPQARRRGGNGRPLRRRLAGDAHLRRLRVRNHPEPRRYRAGALWLCRCATRRLPHVALVNHERENASRRRPRSHGIRRRSPGADQRSRSMHGARCNPPRGDDGRRRPRLDSGRRT